jgi:cytochrome c peroxidase
MRDALVASRIPVAMIALLAAFVGAAGPARGEVAAHGVVPLVARVEQGRASATLLQANARGAAETLHAAGRVDLGNLFFRPLGTNGRSCDSCHVSREGWSLSPAGVQARFAATDGNDPLFRPNDGSTSPHAEVTSTQARRDAYALLLSKGLIRVGLPVPATAEFELVKVVDPYGFASATELSLFRRPLPATNLTLSDSVMWDGRETLVDPASGACIAGTPLCYAGHFDNLARQANGATVGHAQALAPLTPAQRDEIVSFELGLTTAQRIDDGAGNLAGGGARGGAVELAAQRFYLGINDFAAGDYRDGGAFQPAVFSLYAAWRGPVAPHADPGIAEARRAIARGEELFNARTFDVHDVGGFNDVVGAPTARVTCGACHDAPNSGASSVPAFIDIGVSAASRRTPDVPLYTLRHKVTGETLATTDPGRALVTGRWDDIGRFKVPSLRALAARPPYFHDGSAPDLAAVVEFYDRRFQMHLTPVEIADLVAFLQAL